MNDFNTSHWTQAQRDRFDFCVAQGDTLAFCNTDQHGRPANGGTGRQSAATGLIQTLGNGHGPTVLCGAGALHATLKPHQWRGCRTWVVALRGDVQWSGSNKCGGRVREFIGEILPEECVEFQVFVRIANLYQANLSWANLYQANLSRANLSQANLYGAQGLTNEQKAYARNQGALNVPADL